MEDEKAVMVEEKPNFDDKIEQWYQKHFHNARLDTVLQNKLFEAKEDLKQILKG